MGRAVLVNSINPRQVDRQPVGLCHEFHSHCNKDTPSQSVPCCVGKGVLANRHRWPGHQGPGNSEHICLLGYLLKLIHRSTPQGRAGQGRADSSAWVIWVQTARLLLLGHPIDGELYGHHWKTIRSLLPVYQAITSVKIELGAGER